MREKVHRLLHRLLSYPAWVPARPPDYQGDRMFLWNKSVEFASDEKFANAYELAMATDKKLPPLHHRIATTTWAAVHGAHLPGDFVECGVNTGVASLAICDYLDFNNIDKCFYLFDTYCGIPPEQVGPNESGKIGRYPDCYMQTKETFAPYPRVILVRGIVPESLPSAPIEKVAYLHIDMNIEYPERAAIEYFWPKLVSGAVVVLDDYGFIRHREQMLSMNEFARLNDVSILTLPTGQGLLLKP